MSYPVVESSATALSADNLSLSVVVGLPSGTVAGDLLVAWIATDGAVTITEPGDWIEIAQGHPTSYASGGAFYRVAGASEPSTYSFGVSAAEGIAGGIIRISGADLTTPINISSLTVHDSPSTTSDAPSVMTTADECLILRFAFLDAGYTPGASPATSIWAIEKGSVGGVGNMAAWDNLALAGNTGTATFTHRDEQGGNATVAIAPLAIVPPAEPIGGPLKAGGNVTISLNGYDLTPHLHFNSAQVEGVVNTFRSTVFSSTAETWIPTTSKWTFPVGGLWSVFGDWVLYSLVTKVPSEASIPVPLRIGIGTSVLTWTDCLFTEYKIVATPRDAIRWTAKIIGQGAPEQTWQG